ncbi:lysyl-tRNA synthetase class 2 [Litorivivens lipolytica]|uniref:Lysyl-tRNA synthetase class 2 n=1 Tax=Litorivivens lipolytica TaxID=1524264 RepID=A0A7W4W7X1_9GAMM|nr:EF-P lysine aminoacylase EpmA [Litorivivens lipolytica]MBB3048539.1 lysyl-tRNA synthetase class 2 [Litorivivens lipolytica]
MSQSDWQPTAALSALRARAELLATVREFFKQRGVLEVETPLLASAPVTDPAIEAFSLAHAERYLQTSPEYAMKRLLAAGSGPIYQLCKAFRQGESGRRHNPEFSMLEWYRPGFSLDDLMAEVGELLCAVLGERPVQRYDFAALFEREFALDLFAVEATELGALAEQRHGIPAASLDRDEAINLLFSHDIEPKLGRGEYSLVCNFPPSQAALAKRGRDAQGREVAVRFEAFVEGIELANGYDELLDASELKSRFESDLKLRQERGQVCPPMDEKLLAAMAHGLPACAGVAMGFDRLLMLQLGAENLAEVLAFPTARA